MRNDTRMSPRTFRRKPVVRMGIIAALIAMTSVPAMTAVAAPDHGPGQRIARHEGGGYRGRGYFQRREHQRGLTAGRREGWRNGYADGLSRGRFDPWPLRKLRGSRAFVRAYRRAYQQTYGTGFEAGRRQARRYRRGYRRQWDTPCY